MIYVGTSGWQYADWRGPFYPREIPQSQWLSYLSSRFPTIELNNSFYRLPDRRTFESWRGRVPDGFVMAVKASRYITHLKRLRDAGDAVARLLDHARGLGDRLGPVLFQLPPRFPADAGRLREFLTLLPPDTRPAFEFRDPTWEQEEVYDLLHAKGAALVWPDRPGARVRLPVTGGWGYVRFHQGRADGAGYSRDKLRRWAGRVAAMEADDVFVYFNNDPGAAAVHDAAAFIELLQKAGARVASPRIAA